MGEFNNNLSTAQIITTWNSGVTVNKVWKDSLVDYFKDLP
jgi:hypothetical protein